MLRVNQLAGFNVHHRLREVSFVASSVSNANTITAPSGIMAGDLLVLHDRANHSSLPTAVTPAGWTTPSGANVSLTEHRQMVSYRLADGTEGGATITGMDGSTSDSKIMLVFRGNVPIRTVTASGFGSSVMTDGNPSAINLSLASQPVPLVAVASYGSGGTVDPRTFSPAADSEVSQAANNVMAYKIYSHNPADTSVDMDDEGNRNGLIAGFFLLS